VQQCTAGISSFSFRQAYQQMNEWCWAACISMVFAYYDHPVSQQRIVAETWGSVQNMPAQPADILTDLNKDWKDDDGDAFTSSGDMLSVNPVTAIEDLQQDHPLIVGALGHAMVLTALTGNTDLLTQQWGIVAATVRDPMPGNGGKRILSPREWYNISFAARIRVA
jgi:ABC-type bacteriocin/lantibiotic exporter with double-glycine peptidase domain